MFGVLWSEGVEVPKMGVEVPQNGGGVLSTGCIGGCASSEMRPLCGVGVPNGGSSPDAKAPQLGSCVCSFISAARSSSVGKMSVSVRG